MSQTSDFKVVIIREATNLPRVVLGRMSEPQASFPKLFKETRLISLTHIDWVCIVGDMEENTYLVMEKAPLEMEGSDKVWAVADNFGTANKGVELLNEYEETITREKWGDRWKSFASVFYVKEVVPTRYPIDILEAYKNSQS